MKQYDLIVVGGGMAGVAAAVSGAREGLSVLLIERSGCLGGAMANSLVYPFMQYETRDGCDHAWRMKNAVARRDKALKIVKTPEKGLI